MQFKILRKLAKYFPLNVLRNFIDFMSHYFGGLFRKIDEHHLFLSGAGIAFSLVLSVIPFIIILFAILGNVVNPETIEAQITRLIETVIPYPAYADFSKRVILSRIPEVVQYKTIAAYIGGFGLFFTSTWLFSGMRTILNRIFGVSFHRSAWIGLLRDFGMVLLLVIFVLLSIFILPSINFLLHMADNVDFLNFLRLPDITDNLFSIISIIIIFLLFFSFYYLIPYEKIGKRVPLVSAFWATLLWEIAKNLFGYYIANFLATNKVYGAFLIIIVIAFWIFYASCLFIIGAEIGQLYREKNKLYLNKELRN